MEKHLRALCKACLCIFIVLAPFANGSQVASKMTPSIFDESSDIRIKAINQEKSIDDLVGPELNFPFRPENHRDNSSPMARIGIIRTNE